MLVLAAAAVAQENVPAPVAAPGAVLAQQTEPSAPTSKLWPLLARIGVRAGYSFLAPGEGLEYNDGPSLSLYIALARSAESRISCELGGDAAYFDEAHDPYYQSFLFSERLDFLFALPMRHVPLQAYVLSGIAAVEELILNAEGELRALNFAGAVNLGGGVSFRDGRFDLRFTQSLFIGSGNAKGLTTLSVAYRF